MLRAEYFVNPHYFTKRSGCAIVHFLEVVASFNSYGTHWLRVRYLDVFVN